jgi:hypothetical protein
MMKTVLDKDINNRGAALIIALTASVVVMMSVMLLLGYISGMVDTQRTLEDRAQARLTESSAVEGLSRLLSESMVNDYHDLPDFPVGSMVTSFEVRNMEVTPSRELRLTLEGMEEAELLPSGDGLFVIGIRDGFLTIDLFDPVTGCMIPGYPMQVCGDPGAWDAAAGLIGDEPVAFVIASGATGNVVYCVIGGDVTSFQTDVVTWSDASLFSVGGVSSLPALLITDGWNLGQLVIPDAGFTCYGWSPNGTCPVFLPDGSLYGSFSHEPSFGFAGNVITDTFQGDFNSDGIIDVAWAGHSSLTFYSGLTGELILDNLPGQSLVAWGSVEGRFGLGGLWTGSYGERTWRRLAYNGFQNYSGGGVLDNDWSGRIEGLNNLLIGIMGDSLCIASLGLGEINVICSAASGFLGDVDGYTTDIISLDGNEVTLVMNPLDGDGLLLETYASTCENGRSIIGNSWDYYIYGSGEDRRVYVEGEGVDR